MTEEKLPDLTPGAKRIADTAEARQVKAGHALLGVHHWLLVLCERHNALVGGMLHGGDVDAMILDLTQKLAANELGAALPRNDAVAQVGQLALRHKKMRADVRDLAEIIFSASGLPKLSTPGEESGISPDNPIEIKPEPAPTPTLDQFGRDLTQAASEGKLSALVGREEELQLMMETLCRNTKRNPALIGPAGVGKTAIVEGLANKVISGNVPAPLKDARIISLQPSVLVAGTNTRGDLEKRMEAILGEAAQDRIILFIDEIHTIIGAGGMVGTSDLGALLKPALARGEIAVIAATTDDEYRRFIEADTALERRFQPIRINELSPEQTYQVVTALRDRLSLKYKVQVDDDVLGWLVQFGQQYMKNRQFPDKAVDLLEQSIAHAVAQGSPVLNMTEAQEVAQRMVGMPLSLENRLSSLQTVLQEQGLMRPEEVGGLLNRLQVTMRGLDLRASRPNAVLLLSGAAAELSETISRTIAGSLFGDAERVIAIDMSRMQHPEDISLLVGAPPGYIGYSERLPLHRLIQIPWCVVRLENIDQCHPSVRAVINQGLQEGRLTDGQGKSIYFSDAVVLMTAEVTIHAQRSLGFQLKEEQGVEVSDVYKAVAETIGNDLASQVDLFMPGIQPATVSKVWLKDHMLADLAERYLKQGLQLNWDTSLVDWLAESRNQFLSEHDWERWIDYSLSPAIVDYLPRPGGPKVNQVNVSMEQDKIKVEPA